MDTEKIEIDNNIKQIGIYCIETKKTNKKYIGSSVDIGKRITSHFRDLEREQHRNYKLQRAYNAYKKKGFNTYILELCSKERLLDREQYYIDFFNTYKKGYNLEDADVGIVTVKLKTEVYQALKKLAGERKLSATVREMIIKNLKVEGYL